MLKDRTFWLKKQIDYPVYRQIVRTMPIFCVDLVIIQDKKILLGKRNNKPLQGMYFTPGGRLYRGETIEEAVRRKANEELGIDVTDITRIAFYEEFYKENTFDDLGVQTIGFFCKCTPIGTKIFLNDEHEDYKWLPFDSPLIHPITKKMLDGETIVQWVDE